MANWTGGPDDTVAPRSTQTARQVRALLLSGAPGAAGAKVVDQRVDLLLAGARGEGEIVYRRAAAAPAAPAGGSWDGSALTPPAGWTLAAPGGAGTLYRSLVTLGAPGAAPAYGAPEPVGGGTPPPPEATEAEADAGTGTGLRSWSPARLWRAARAAVRGLFTVGSSSGYVQASGGAGLAHDDYQLAVTSPDGSQIYDIQNAGGEAGWAQVRAAASGRVHLNNRMGDSIGEFGQASGARATPVLAVGHRLRISPRGTGAAIGSHVELLISSGPTAVAGPDGGASRRYDWSASSGAGDMTALNGVYLVGTEDQPDQTVPGEALTGLGGLLARLVLLGAWPAAAAAGLARFIAANSALDPVASAYTSLRDRVRDLLDAVFARLDGSNLTAAFRDDVRGPWEPYTVTADQTRLANIAAVAADDRLRFVSDPVLGGSEVGIVWRLGAADYGPVLAHWSTDRRIELPAGALRITGGVSELGNRTLQANVALIEGAAPAVGAAFRPTIRGVPRWADVRTSIRGAGAADDDHLATERAVRDALPPAPPAEAVVYTATRTLDASDIGKWVGMHTQPPANSNKNILLSGALGAVGDRIILALRTQGNYTIALQWVQGTLVVYHAMGRESLTAAGTINLVPVGGNRALIFTAEKTAAAEWTVREGVWW